MLEVDSNPPVSVAISPRDHVRSLRVVIRNRTYKNIKVPKADLTKTTFRPKNLRHQYVEN